MQKLKGWKTVVANTLTLVVAITAWPEVVELVDPQILLAISALSNIVLRMVTTSKVGQS